MENVSSCLPYNRVEIYKLVLGDLVPLRVGREPLVDVKDTSYSKAEVERMAVYPLLRMGRKPPVHVKNTWDSKAKVERMDKYRLAVLHLNREIRVEALQFLHPKLDVVFFNGPLEPAANATPLANALLGANRGTIRTLTLEIHVCYGLRHNLLLRGQAPCAQCSSWRAILSALMTKEQLHELSELKFVIKDKGRLFNGSARGKNHSYKNGFDYFSEVIHYFRCEHLDPSKVCIELDGFSIPGSSNASRFWVGDVRPRIVME